MTLFNCFSLILSMFGMIDYLFRNIFFLFLLQCGAFVHQCVFFSFLSLIKKKIYMTYQLYGYIVLFRKFDQKLCYNKMSKEFIIETFRTFYININQYIVFYNKLIEALISQNEQWIQNGLFNGIYRICQNYQCFARVIFLFHKS